MGSREGLGAGRILGVGVGVGVGALTSIPGIGKVGAGIWYTWGVFGGSWTGDGGSEDGESFGLIETDFPAPHRHLNLVELTSPTTAVRMMFAKIKTLAVSMGSYIFFHAIISVTRMSPPIAA